MTIRISEDITVTLTKNSTIKAYENVQKCAKELADVSKLAHQAYEDAFVTGTGYDRSDFYDFEEAVGDAQARLYDAYVALEAC